EELAGPGVLERLVEGAAREAERSAGDRRTEDVERAHGELEAAARLAEGRGARIREAQLRHRVWRDDVDALGGVHVGRVDDEGADALVSLGEGDIEARDAAVRDPRLRAVQRPGIATALRARRHRLDIRSRIRFRQREGGDRL